MSVLYAFNLELEIWILPGVCVCVCVCVCQGLNWNSNWNASTTSKEEKNFFKTTHSPQPHTHTQSKFLTLDSKHKSTLLQCSYWRDIAAQLWPRNCLYFKKYLLDEKSREWNKSDFKNCMKQNLEQKIFLFYDPRISLIGKKCWEFALNFLTYTRVYTVLECWLHFQF